MSSLSTVHNWRIPLCCSNPSMGKQPKNRGSCSAEEEFGCIRLAAKLDKQQCRFATVRRIGHIGSHGLCVRLARRRWKVRKISWREIAITLHLVRSENDRNRRKPPRTEHEKQDDEHNALHQQWADQHEPGAKQLRITTTFKLPLDVQVRYDRKRAARAVDNATNVDLPRGTTKSHPIIL
jgi:hypothetical protein